jgi:hypothetical protein
MGGTYSTYEKHEKCVKKYLSQNLKANKNLENTV